MSDFDIKMKLSYVEIYNEQIKDLLDNKENKKCSLRDDPLGGVNLSNVLKIDVSDTKKIMKLLWTGNVRRTTEATNANKTSSRSHAIL